MRVVRPSADRQKSHKSIEMNKRINSIDIDKDESDAEAKGKEENKMTTNKLITSHKKKTLKYSLLNDFFFPCN